MASKQDINSQEMSSYGLFKSSFKIPKSTKLLSDIMEEDIYASKESSESFIKIPEVTPDIQPLSTESSEVDSLLDDLVSNLPFFTKQDVALTKIKMKSENSDPRSYVSGLIFGATLCEKALRKSQVDETSSQFEKMITTMRKELKAVQESSESIVISSSVIPDSITKLNELSNKFESMVRELKSILDDIEDIIERERYKATKINSDIIGTQDSPPSLQTTNSTSESFEEVGNINITKLIRYMVDNNMEYNTARTLAKYMNNDNIMADIYLGDEDKENQLFELVLDYATKLG